MSSIINISWKQTLFKDLCDVDMYYITSSISSLIRSFLSTSRTLTHSVHVSCARFQEENPQLPATTSTGDWGKLEVNRRTVVPVRALHTWVSGSESDLAPVPVWLPVCLDGPSPEWAVVHSGLGVAPLSRVMERSGQPGLSLPLYGVWVKPGPLWHYRSLY